MDRTNHHNVTRPDWLPSLSPLLTKFRPTDAERKALTELLSEAQAVEAQLVEVSHDATKRRLKLARTDLIEKGVGEQERFQHERRALDDSQELRRASKSRLKFLGREAARTLHGILQRAVPHVERELGAIVRATEERLQPFFKNDELPDVLKADATVAGLRYRLAMLVQSRGNMRDCVESGFVAYATTIRRALGPELSSIYFGTADNVVAASV